MPQTRHLLFCALVVCCFSATSEAGQRACLEFRIGEDLYQGALVAHDDKTCWILSRDGSLESIELRKVTEYREVSPQFRSYSLVELREELRREFGNEYEVASSGKYLVCGPPGKAQSYAALFDDMYRSFRRYFSSRSFQLTEPEFPMVAIVFPNRHHFAAYSRMQGVTAGTGLMGYYLHTTNRVALFDSGAAPVSMNESRDHANAPQSLAEAFGTTNQSAVDRLATGVDLLPHADILPYGSIEADLRDTIVHEATHQVAFNTGLHARLGQNPKWVVEGLATVFESPGVRDRAARMSAKTRINHERFVWFGNFAESRRKPRSLADFVGSDSLFQLATLDAYSQAWALTFYLMETRSSEYAGYLKKIAARDPFQPYSRDERIADFKQAFGNDLDWLDADFVRFFEKMN